MQENAFENVVCQNGSHFVQREMSLIAGNDTGSLQMK